jgi:hypothetical protein
MLPYFSSRRTGVECPASGSWVFRAGGTRTRHTHQRNERAAGCNADTFREPYRPDKRARSRRARPPQRRQPAIRCEDHPKHVSPKHNAIPVPGGRLREPVHHIKSHQLIFYGRKKDVSANKSLTPVQPTNAAVRHKTNAAARHKKPGGIREAAFRNASNRAKPRLDGERRHRSDH